MNPASFRFGAVILPCDGGDPSRMFPAGVEFVSQICPSIYPSSLSLGTPSLTLPSSRATSSSSSGCFLAFTITAAWSRSNALLEQGQVPQESSWEQHPLLHRAVTFSRRRVLTNIKHVVNQRVARLALPQPSFQINATSVSNSLWASQCKPHPVCLLF